MKFTDYMKLLKAAVLLLLLQKEFADFWDFLKYIRRDEQQKGSSPFHFCVQLENEPLDNKEVCTNDRYNEQPQEQCLDV